MPWKLTTFSEDGVFYLKVVREESGEIVDESAPILYEPAVSPAILFDNSLQVPYLVDQNYRKYYLINPSSWQEAYETSRSKIDYNENPESGRMICLWFGQGSPTLILMWKEYSWRGEDYEGPLETAVEFIQKVGWKGLYVEDEELGSLIAEAKEDILADAKEEIYLTGREIDEETLNELAYEKATEDLTYTESGYVSSQEWGIYFNTNYPRRGGLVDVTERSKIPLIVEAAYKISRAMYPDDDLDWDPQGGKPPSDFLKLF